MGPATCTILGPYLRKRILYYKQKIRYETECLFRMRKEIKTNYKSQKADKYHKHHKIHTII
jgi:hypothetical protein